MEIVEAIVSMGLILVIAYTLMKGDTQKIKKLQPLVLPVVALMFGFAVYEFRATGNNWDLTFAIIWFVVFVHTLFRSIARLRNQSNGG